MTDQVEIARRAIKTLAGLPRREQQRIRAAIDLLAENPRPPACLAMAGVPGSYRVRVGGYRIIYELHDDRLVVQVVRPGHRSDVYRRYCRMWRHSALRPPSANVIQLRSGYRCADCDQVIECPCGYST